MGRDFRTLCALPSKPMPFVHGLLTMALNASHVTFGDLCFQRFQRSSCGTQAYRKAFRFWILVIEVQQSRVRLTAIDTRMRVFVSLNDQTGGLLPRLYTALDGGLFPPIVLPMVRSFVRDVFVWHRRSDGRRGTWAAFFNLCCSVPCELKFVFRVILSGTSSCYERHQNHVRVFMKTQFDFFDGCFRRRKLG